MKISQFFPLVLGTLMFLSPNYAGETDTQLYYEKQGEGETIIFVHGLQEDYRVFLPQLEALKKSYRVVTYSRRYNHPNRYRYHASHTFNVFTEAEDLAFLVDELETTSVHLVGHSFGGLIAMAFTNQHPDKVKSLILSEPPLLRLPECESWHEHLQEELIEKGKAAHESGDSTNVMTVIFEFFAGSDIQGQVPPDFLRSLYANLGEVEALFHSDDPFPDLNTDIEIPSMIITAGNTMPMLECTNKALLQRMPEAIHLHLPGVTHDMWMTHPDELSRAVNEFISGNPD